jgi:kynurenine formamidase
MRKLIVPLFVSVIALVFLVSGIPRAAINQGPPQGVPRNVVDNTHTLAPGIASYSGVDTIEIIPIFTFPVHGFAANALELPEHFGTHVDAPFHFAGPGHLFVNEIEVQDLVGPAVVVDVRDKVASDEDYRLTAADLQAWERGHGRIPRGAIVIMFSGWGERWDDPLAYRNFHDGAQHYPGFSAESVQWLLDNRDIIGIGIDTLSIDYGPSTDFIAHRIINGADKWAVENLANMDQIPEAGGLMVVSPMKIEGGTGGTARAYTLFNSARGK